MLTEYVGLVFRCKYVQFRTIYLFHYITSNNTVEVDLHPDSLHNGVMEPKNKGNQVLL